MTGLRLALRAALYMGCFALLWGWLALAVRGWDPRLGGPLPAWLQPVGAVVALAGGALALWCGCLFVARGHGTPAPFDPPRAFVTEGPYRWTRNPMYVGGLTLLAGGGLWLRSPAILLLAAAAWSLVHLFVTLYEEPRLRRQFGPAYESYARRVNRWLPRRPSSPHGA